MDFFVHIFYAEKCCRKNCGSRDFIRSSLTRFYRKCHRNGLDSLAVGELHYLRRAVSHIAVSSPCIIGNGVYPAVVEIYSCAFSVIGAGVRSHSGVAAKMFGALANAGINTEMVTTSEIRITALIDEAYADQAMRAIHETFLE